MSESNGISAHGTLIKLGGTPIGELRDISGPALTRKAIETTTHNSSDDSFVMGVRRHGEVSFTINFLPSADDVLIDDWEAGTKGLYEIDFPDGATWTFSGYVSQVSPKMPVDGSLEAACSIRPTGIHVFNPA